jgi:hypothetical protein
MRLSFPAWLRRVQSLLVYRAGAEGRRQLKTFEAIA